MRRGSTQKRWTSRRFDVVLDMQGASSLDAGAQTTSTTSARSSRARWPQSKHGLQLGDQVLASAAGAAARRTKLLTKVLVPSPVHKFSIKRSPFGLHTVQILVHGCLQKKQPSGLRQWQTRWFELSQVDLVYYAGQKDEEPRGVIPLKNVRSVERSSDGKKFVVSVEDLLPGSGKRAFELQAASSLVRERWVRALQMLTRGNDVRMQEEAAADGGRGGGGVGAVWRAARRMRARRARERLVGARAARRAVGRARRPRRRRPHDRGHLPPLSRRVGGGSDAAEAARAAGAAGAAAALDGVSGVCLAALIKALLREMPDDLWASVRPQLADTMADESASALDVARALPEREATSSGSACT